MRRLFSIILAVCFISQNTFAQQIPNERVVSANGQKTYYDANWDAVTLNQRHIINKKVISNFYTNIPNDLDCSAGNLSRHQSFACLLFNGSSSSWVTCGKVAGCAVGGIASFVLAIVIYWTMDNHVRRYYTDPANIHMKNYHWLTTKDRSILSDRDLFYEFLKKSHQSKKMADIECLDTLIKSLKIEYEFNANDPLHVTLKYSSNGTTVSHQLTRVELHQFFKEISSLPKYKHKKFLEGFFQFGHDFVKSDVTNKNLLDSYRREAIQSFREKELSVPAEYKRHAQLSEAQLKRYDIWEAETTFWQKKGHTFRLGFAAIAAVGTVWGLWELLNDDSPSESQIPETDEFGSDYESLENNLLDPFPIIAAELARTIEEIGPAMAFAESLETSQY
jgi:hypothetical protein